MQRAYDTIEDAWAILREFLGVSFDIALTDFATCCLFSESEFNRLGDRFYEESEAYLYELTHFHFMACKEGFFLPLIRFARLKGLSRLADFGCGVGLDAQMLLKQGFDVDCFDFRSPCSQYLEWRLRRDPARTTTVQELFSNVSSPYDLAYAMDVLEHAQDPLPVAQHLFASARHVCVNLFSHDPGDRPSDHMHYPLNHWTLLPALTEFGTLLEVGVSGDTVVTIWQSHLCAGECDADTVE